MKMKRTKLEKEQGEDHIVPLPTQAAAICTQHAYLTTKGVQGHGVKIEGENLVIPMIDTTGKVQSLQSITPDGDKRFLSGGRVKGCYHAIGKPAGVLIVCEGYATGASIHESTGDAVAVAFNAGNLEAVPGLSTAS